MSGCQSVTVVRNKYGLLQEEQSLLTVELSFLTLSMLFNENSCRLRKLS